MTLDTNNIFYEPKGCYMCCMMRVVTIYLCKHSIYTCIGRYTATVDTELYAPGQLTVCSGLHSDLMTG